MEGFRQFVACDKTALIGQYLSLVVDDQGGWGCLIIYMSQKFSVSEISRKCRGIVSQFLFELSCAAHCTNQCDIYGVGTEFMGLSKKLALLLAPSAIRLIDHDQS